MVPVGLSGSQQPPLLHFDCCLRCVLCVGGAQGVPRVPLATLLGSGGWSMLTFFVEEGNRGCGDRSGAIYVVRRGLVQGCG